MDRGDTVVFAGTKRGLFMLSSKDRQCWTVEQHALPGCRVYNAVYDPRTGRTFAADNGVFWGNFVRYSDDLGETWHEPSRGIQFPEGSDQKLEAIWIIQPGRESEPDTIYAGVDPATLWISEDRGETWNLCEGLLNHPSRDQWQPGAGGLCLHSIVPDHSNRDRMWIGISAVGAMRTDDGGQTWRYVNRNTRAGFLPAEYPEFGQCIHRLIQHPTESDTLYQQNHCGVYKSLNGGEDWIDIQGTLPSEFGFPVALDHNNPDTVFTIVENPEGRYNFGEQFTVYRTQDAGGSWETLSNGLPTGTGVKLGVLRHGMCADAHDPCGVYVGTNTGQIFASADAGDSWRTIADYLPPIYSVTVATIE
jgi:hypothetical protein